MKRLLLIRHSKSSWKFPELDDHDRPLNKRGERDRHTMAAALESKNEELDAIYSSSAARALLLAQILSERLAVSLVERQALYTFGSGSLASVVKQLPGELERVAVVGHNPAVTDLCQHLTRAGISNIPTSGIVAINCHCDEWQSVSPANCELSYFIAPKLL